MLVTLLSKGNPRSDFVEGKTTMIFIPDGVLGQQPIGSLPVKFILPIIKQTSGNLPLTTGNLNTISLPLPMNLEFLI